MVLPNALLVERSSGEKIIPKLKPSTKADVDGVIGLNPLVIANLSKIEDFSPITINDDCM